ncbi:MAG: sensor histidine kinase, partial [Clostridia bacterium]|nr:sensor histidine kinase [Clostridia bacterium]
ILDMASASVVGIIILALPFAGAKFLIVFYRNNLKLTKALKEADESKKQLEEAYNQLSETAVFQERNRIARDIHDNAGHSMTAVIMQTEAAKLLIDRNPEEAKAKIIAANIQAKNALEQMRESVHLLAGRDTAMSLKEELEEILAQTMDGTGVKIRCDIGDVSLAGDRRRFIANSLKECLSNGMRHGGADAFYVEFSEDGGEVCLTVSDNGKGLPEDFKEGFGIRGVREKAAAFGGGIVFESESGDGCEIKITIKEE